MEFAVRAGDQSENCVAHGVVSTSVRIQSACSGLVAGGDALAWCEVVRRCCSSAVGALDLLAEASQAIVFRTQLTRRLIHPGTCVPSLDAARVRASRLEQRTL